MELGQEDCSGGWSLCVGKTWEARKQRERERERERERWEGGREEEEEAEWAVKIWVTWQPARDGSSDFDTVKKKCKGNSAGATATVKSPNM